MGVLRALRSMRFLDPSPEAMRRPSVPGQTTLGGRGENLSSVLQQICADPRRKGTLINWVRELTPLDVKDFSFGVDRSGKVLLGLVDSNRVETSAYSASDGTLRFLCLLAALLGDDSGMVYFLEDPETGLHPTRLHLLVGLIESRVEAGAIQVIATTHSPQLLGYLSDESLNDVLVAYRKDRQSSQHLRRLYDFPNAEQLVREQDVSELHSTGWFEDMIAFEDEEPWK